MTSSKNEYKVVLKELNNISSLSEWFCAADVFSVLDCFANVQILNRVLNGMYQHELINMQRIDGKILYSLKAKDKPRNAILSEFVINDDSGVYTLTANFSNCRSVSLKINHSIDSRDFIDKLNNFIGYAEDDFSKGII